MLGVEGGRVSFYLGVTEDEEAEGWDLGVNISIWSASRWLGREGAVVDDRVKIQIRCKQVREGKKNK